MPKIIFTPEDESHAEALLEEYDPAKALAQIRMRDMLRADEWAFVVERERDSFRRQIRAAMLTNALEMNDAHYDLKCELMDHSALFEQGRIQDLLETHFALNLWKGLPFEVVEEYEEAVSETCSRMLNRIFGLDSQPIII
jgi:hypothetical protein